MVDPFAYHQFNRHKSVSLRALSAPSPSPITHVHEPHIPNPGPPGHIHRPSPPLPALTIEKKACPNESEQAELSDEQLLICVLFVKGYSFKNKEWGMLFLFHRYIKMKLTCDSPSQHSKTNLETKSASPVIIFPFYS
jgi:hypothetical protein